MFLRHCKSACSPGGFALPSDRTRRSARGNPGSPESEFLCPAAFGAVPVPGLKENVIGIGREYPEAARENLLVLDATTGKNAVSQVQEFGDVADITGIILTKLDGTAKGGIVVTIADEFDMPVKFIGVGEGIEDLKSSIL